MVRISGVRNAVFLGFGLVATLGAATAFAHGSGGFPPDAGAKGAVRALPPDPGTFVNFETPHVHPIDLSPDGTILAAVNTPDNRLEVFSVDGTGALTHVGAISVGYDPVSVRFRSNTEAWVVNQISDSVSVVNIPGGIVTRTIQTGDEPADVVFYTDAGNAAPLAAVSCSRPDKIQVFNANTHALVDELDIFSEDPRALATDGTNVYVAAFASGNSTTIIPNNTIGDALEDPAGPYSGQNPPFNNGEPGTAWVTPLGSDDFGSVFAPPPQVSLIVRKDFSDGDKWKDDNGADWTNWISGADAAKSGRVLGWDMTDNDIASFQTNNGTTALNGGFGTSGWVTRRMNTCMALGINPADGSLILVGTDATNEIRFEPNINGTFTHVMAAINDGTTGVEIALVDMNEAHLDAAQGGVGMAYSDPSVPQSERDKSIGDPRGVAFNPAGTRAYVTGMGSGNILVLDPSTGARLGGLGYTIDLGSPTPGPTGAIHHPTHNRLYVVNRFDSSVMAVDTSTLGSESVTQTLPFYDPTPDFINTGRDDFYDTHQNSGLGQIACASCHIDGRNDQLAWDLGNPQGGVKPSQQVDPNNPSAGEHNLFLNGFIEAFDDFHDMKGPMTTQTLIDIIGKEPFHWRGDRDGLEEFAAAFSGLQGDDQPLMAGPMQEFEDFLSSLHFGPNPFRALDNSLPGGPKFIGAGSNPLLPLNGYFSNGPTSGNPGLSARGTPLPDGDAFRGFQLYVQGNPLHTGAHPDAPESLDNVFQCVTCHTLPTGAGSVDLAVFTGQFNYVDIAPGPNGENHMALFPADGTGNTDGVTGSVNQGTFTIPQLRNQLDKHGFNAKLANASTLGFGVLHDGSVDDLDTFLGSNAFDVDNDQDVADLVAFVLCINGDGFDDLAALPGAPNFFSPPGLPINLATTGQLGPDGGDTRTAHAATGKQVTIASATPPAPDQALIDLFVALAQNNAVDLIAKGVKDGNRRGWYLTAGTMFQSDINGETISLAALMALAGSGTELTFTLVPEGSGERMGVDRDEDGWFDFREILDGTDPADPDSRGGPLPAGDGPNYGLLTALLALLGGLLLGARRLRVKHT